jgi:hypothetical protein
VQTALKMENNMRFGGHNMGTAPELLGAAMKAIIAAIMEHAKNCATKPDWWTKGGGGGGHQVQGQTIFDRNNLTLLFHHRGLHSASRNPPCPSHRLRLRFNHRTSVSSRSTSAPASIELDWPVTLWAARQRHSPKAPPASNMAVQMAWRGCRVRTVRKCGGACTSASCSHEWAALLRRTRTC